MESPSARVSLLGICFSFLPAIAVLGCGSKDSNGNETDPLKEHLGSDGYTVRVSPRGGMIVYENGMALVFQDGWSSSNQNIALSASEDVSFLADAGENGVTIRSAIADVKPDGLAFEGPVFLILDGDYSKTQESAVFGIVGGSDLSFEVGGVTDNSELFVKLSHFSKRAAWEFIAKAYPGTRWQAWRCLFGGLSHPFVFSG